MQAEAPGHLPLSIEQASLLRASAGRIRTAKFPLVFQLSGHLDIPFLRSALQTVLSGHEALRLRLVRAPDGTLLQRFAPVDPAATLHIVDLPDVSSLEDMVRRQFTAPMELFDPVPDPADHPLRPPGPNPPSRGPFRASLLRLNDSTSFLACTVHHLAWDERSRGVFISELAGAYQAAVDGRPGLARRPGAWTRHVREQMAAGPRLAAGDVAWWQSRLQGTSAPPRLSGHRSDVQPETPSGLAADQWSTAWRANPLDRAAMDVVSALARRCRCTVPAVIHSLLAGSLAKWASAEAIRYYYLYHGRDHRWQGDVIGFFARSIPLVFRAVPQEPWAQTCRRVMRDTAGVVARTTAPFSTSRLMTQLREEYQPGQQPESPLSTVALNLEVLDEAWESPPTGSQLVVRRLTRPEASGGPAAAPPVPRPGRLWIWAHIGPETVLRAEFDSRSYPLADVQAILNGVRTAVAELA